MKSQKELPWTGERLVTQQKDMHFVIEHLHRYALAMKLASNKIVLDVACGEGYGSNLLAEVADKVFGVDIDVDTIVHAREKYQEYKPEKLTYLQGDVTNLPHEIGLVDMIVSFETLEHVKDQEAMLASFKRHLKPNGIVLISTPEKILYQKRSTNNPYHLKELSLPEFKNLINDFFPFSFFYEQRFVFGSCITPLNLDSSMQGFDFLTGDYQNISKGNGTDTFYNQPFFIIAVCGLHPMAMPSPSASIFEGGKVYHAIQAGYKKSITDLTEWNTRISKDWVIRIWLRIKSFFS